MNGFKLGIARAVSRVNGFLSKSTFHRTAGFRVLMYHSIGSRIPGDRLGTYSLQEGEFVKQMDFIRDQKISTLHLYDAVNKNSGLSVTFDDGYKNTLTRAAPLLIERNIPFTVFVTRDFVTSGDPLYLSAFDLRELARLPGVTIGSHGCTHSKLSMCTREDLLIELTESKHYLEDIIQKPIKSVSYPHGSVDDRVRLAAYEIGYEFGACSHFGFNDISVDPLLIKRTDVWSSDKLSDFAMKLKGDWDWLRFRG